MPATPCICEPTTERELEELMQDDCGAVVVEVGTSRSAPCKALSRVYRAVAESFTDRPVTFARVRTDRHPHLARALKVRSVPTVLFCADGEVVDATVGRVARAGLTKRVDWLIEHAGVESFFSRLWRRRGA